MQRTTPEIFQGGPVILVVGALGVLVLRRFRRWCSDRRAARGVRYVTHQGWVSMQRMLCVSRADWERMGCPSRILRHPNYAIPPDPTDLIFIKA